MALVDSVADERFDPVAGVALGLSGAGGTVLVVLAGGSYFTFVGPYVLPAVGVLSDLIAIG